MNPLERDEILHGPPHDLMQWHEGEMTREGADRRFTRATAVQQAIDEITALFEAETDRLMERQAELLGPLVDTRNQLLAMVEQWHRSYVADGGTPTVRWTAGGSTLVKKAAQPDLVIEDSEALEAAIEDLGLLDKVYPMPPPPVRKLSKAALRKVGELVEPKDSDPGTPLRLMVDGTVVEGVRFVAKPREFHVKLEGPADV